MKNPATTASRIYIGNILDQVTTVDLEDRFKCYGTILGLVLQRGFGFIQFETESQAQLAIKSEHGALFFGRKLNVKQALDKGKINTPQKNQPPLMHNEMRPQIHKPDLWQNPKMESPPPPTITQPPPQSKPKPLMDIVIPPPKPEVPPEKMDLTVEDTNKPESVENVCEMDQQSQGRISDTNSDTSERKRVVPPPGNRRGGGINRGRQDREFDRFPADDFPDAPPRDIPQRDPVMFYGREENFRPPPAYIPPSGIDRPERNDCEIIVVSRLLTEYAEYIEQRLKGIGLMVDLLYPNEDVPIGRVLANISSRGCLYAILVMPQNEEYRSLTLSILHGIPQEHRNILVEDAITLITRNFDAYMRGDKSTIPGAGAPLLDRHPEGIQMVFNLLAENRQLTSTQYDRIIKYLQERRELQKQFEIVEGEGNNNNETQPNSKQAELQSRIMNILNKSTEDVPKPVEAPRTPSTPTPLLNDPTVQKALDSLLSGDMLKSIASGL
ncbi:hypothetical protein FQR65_LT05799 [Abscondita terminalis]|nr:hypothetical protein FQR65_LT05799 [Abscondita terminalis]